MSEIHLSAPPITALKACSPQAAHKAMAHGSFGPPVRRGRRCFVALAVKRHVGLPFSPEQIARAVTGVTASMIGLAPPGEA
jgi:hypothetical protein